MCSLSPLTSCACRISSTTMSRTFSLPCFWDKRYAASAVAAISGSVRVLRWQAPPLRLSRIAPQSSSEIIFAPKPARRVLFNHFIARASTPAGIVRPGTTSYAVAPSSRNALPPAAAPPAPRARQSHDAANESLRVARRGRRHTMTGMALGVTPREAKARLRSAGLNQVARQARHLILGDSSAARSTR